MTAVYAASESASASVTVGPGGGRGSDTSESDYHGSQTRSFKLPSPSPRTVTESRVQHSQALAAEKPLRHGGPDRGPGPRPAGPSPVLKSLSWRDAFPSRPGGAASASASHRDDSASAPVGPGDAMTAVDPPDSAAESHPTRIITVLVVRLGDSLASRASGSRVRGLSPGCSTHRDRHWPLRNSCTAVAGPTSKQGTASAKWGVHIMHIYDGGFISVILCILFYIFCILCI